MKFNKEEIGHIINSLESYIIDLREHKDEIDRNMLGPSEIREKLSNDAQKEILMNEKILIRLYNERV